LKNSWFANGKLLITGEYLVMDGAKALAVPLKKGQKLEVEQTETGLLEWQAKEPGGLWFKTVFSLPSLKITETPNRDMAEQLRKLLLNAASLSDNFLTNEKGLSVITNLDFDPQYGFGSSSTLVYCIARWANVDPFVLQTTTFGGSGYDIACADAKGPVTYRVLKNKPEVNRVDFTPPFKDNLYFVYLGRKQQTADSISDFHNKASFSKSEIEEISAITDKILKTSKLEDFETLLNRHEQIMSEILKMPTVKSLYFQEFEGVVKSLGAWGGDFVLTTTKKSRQEFIRQMHHLGFNIIYPFNDLVLSPE
jgi:mevalonate kinase